MSELSMEMLVEDVMDTEEAQTGSGDFFIATVATVEAHGLTLILPGESQASEKVYVCNSGVRFAVGDRVKVTAYSGTFMVDYALGNPLSRFPIPSGGADGQVLLKNGTTNFAVRWGSISGLLPSGGTDGQVLTKSGSADYLVAWGAAPRGLPSGGATGQVLKKSSSVDYAVSWGDAGSGLPAGGTDGQALLKDGSVAYAVKWGFPDAGRIKNGSNTLTMGSTGIVLPQSTASVSLGSASYALKDIYASGTIVLGDSYSGSVKLGGTSARLGFFGTSPVAKKAVASTATVATLITALKGYGLIS